jgi:hypothetical protein
MSALTIICVRIFAKTVPIFETLYKMRIKTDGDALKGYSMAIRG